MDYSNARVWLFEFEEYAAVANAEDAEECFLISWKWDIFRNWIKLNLDDGI